MNDFKKRITTLVLGVLFFVGVLNIPLPDGMTEDAKRMLAVVFLMAIWWMGEGTSITVTALLPLILFPLLGILPSKEVAPNYANQMVFLFLGGFMIAIAMEKWNFHKRLALLIVLAIGTSLKRIVLGFMAACAFLSMWISNTATTMMLLPVAMAVTRQIASEASLNGVRNQETEKLIQNSLGLVLMLGLAYSGSIGGVGTLIGTPPNIVFAGFYKKLFPEAGGISFFDWMLFAIPIVCLFLPLVWIYLCRMVAPIPMDSIHFGEGGSEIIRKELDALGKVNSAERAIAVVFVATAGLWIFRKPIALGSFTIPGWSQIFARPELLHDATVAMTMGLLLMLLPVRWGRGLELNGKTEFFILDWPTVQKKAPWGILLLFGGGFALAAGFAKTGLDQWIGQQLASVSTLPLLLVILCLCLGVTFLTELTSNTATTTMILPIIAAIAIAARYQPLLLMIPATLSASFAFMLPVATPPNAIVFSSGWVTIPQMSRAGVFLNITGAALVTTFALLLIDVIFL